MQKFQNFTNIDDLLEQYYAVENSHSNSSKLSGISIICRSYRSSYLSKTLPEMCQLTKIIIKNSKIIYKYIIIKFYPDQVFS